jgi:hypothetical protein
MGLPLRKAVATSLRHTGPVDMKPVSAFLLPILCESGCAVARRKPLNTQDFGGWLSGVSRPYLIQTGEFGEICRNPRDAGSERNSSNPLMLVHAAASKSVESSTTSICCRSM